MVSLGSQYRRSESVFLRRVSPSDQNACLHASLASLTFGHGQTLSSTIVPFGKKYMMTRRFGASSSFLAVFEAPSVVSSPAISVVVRSTIGLNFPQLCSDILGRSPSAAAVPPRKSVGCIWKRVAVAEEEVPEAGSGVQSQSMYAPNSALRVLAPACPSGVLPLSRWNAFTAPVVFGPQMPSTMPA